jgi:uncharacterized protein
MHLPSTFTAWRALAHNPNVRVALLSPSSLTWPWECLHYEALAWYDHWLKGRDTGIMEGPSIRPPSESKLTALALRADGVLAEQEGPAGSRAYIYLPVDSGRPANANPPELPSSLTWETAPITETFDFVGDIELQLDATITAFDTGWIAVLFDVPPAGEPFPITAGWLRASLSRVVEEKSEPGALVIDHRRPTVPVGQHVLYRIPMVANARRIVRGHRLRLILASEDDEGRNASLFGFSHTVVRESSVNTVYNVSRLLLPILRF